MNEYIRAVRTSRADFLEKKLKESERESKKRKKERERNKLRQKY